MKNYTLTTHVSRECNLMFVIKDGNTLVKIYNNLAQARDYLTSLQNSYNSLSLAELLTDQPYSIIQSVN